MSSNHRGEPQTLVWGSAGTEQQRIRQIMANEIETPHWLMYRYSQPAIILGAAQRPDEPRLQRAERYQLPLVKRKSGGGAVLAGPELLSLSVFIPKHHPVAKGSTVSAYVWIARLWQQVFSDYGIETFEPGPEQIASSKQVAEQHGTDWACYSQLGHGELVDGDQRKCLGVSQIRTKHGCALTCGLYLAPPDWSVLAEVMVDQPEAGAILAACNASLKCLLDPKPDVNASMNELPKRLAEKLARELGVSLTPLSR